MKSMEAWKYVITDLGEVRVSPCDNHRQLAKDDVIVSAGFVSWFLEKDYIRASGFSQSLKIDSKPEDGEIIKRAIKENKIVKS